MAGSFGRFAPLAAFALVLAAVPLVASAFWVSLFNYIGLYSLVALGLVLLTGIGGMTSFGQAAFVGLGAYTTAVLTAGGELPPWLAWAGGSPWLALALGCALTASFAWLIGLVTLRLSGHYLPLGTIAWGISLYYLFGNLQFLGGHTGLTGIPPIPVGGWSLADGRAVYVLIWLLLGLAIWALRNLLDSRQGRAIRALKGGLVMAESMGVDTAAYRMRVFVIAALLACLSGWVYAHMQRFVNPTPFGLNSGIEYLFMAVIGGAASLWGAVLGATLMTVLKQWLQDWLPRVIDVGGSLEVVVFGLLMLAILQRFPDGLWPALMARLPGRRTWRADRPVHESARPRETTPREAMSGDATFGEGSIRKPVPSARASGDPRPGAAASDAPLSGGSLALHDGLPARAPSPRGTVVLEAHRVTRRFGGLAANENIDLELRAGEIHALIGPNGAGKSTFFNQISGVDTPTSGTVRLAGEELTGQASRVFAARGLGRTFQHVRLLPTMTVLDNVAIGAHLRGRAGLLRSMLHAERAEERAILAEARRQIARVGLAEHAADAAGQLPLGKQRIVEIARALAADPRILLLDEPAAGLRHLEKRALAALLARLRDEGQAILLVEHDIDFVMGIADRVTVLDFGQVIARGSPAQVQADPRVIEAYLGTD